ncbi:MAG: aminotransferase class III-fold pyridoxal phosphate-dependent enzyme [Candidatus Wallbacteria bacterium]|nr:aminotransferase class III-fold pyridoxal phosphate-dependent enzyme [Candidatus Wallbacteria bacterium]
MQLGITRPLTEAEQDELSSEAFDSYDAYCNRWPKSVREWGPSAVVEWSGEGVWLRDIRGRAFLDCLGGYGVFALGHRHPRVIEAVKAQLDRLPLHSQKLVNPYVAEAARRLAGIVPGNLRKSFWCNSGTEAVEGALKLARLYTKKKTFVSTTNSFHGKSFGSLSVTGRALFRDPVAPLLPARFVPFGDAAALEKAIDADTAAFIVEPIQGEGGVHLPPEGYLAKVREICTRRGILMIVDEIQTGLGRTGKMFGVDHEGVQPDILCLAKALSGGVVPCGALVSTDEIWSAFHPMPLFHTSTFGHNPLAATAAAATIEVLTTEKLPERAARMGERLMAGLRELWRSYPKVLAEVRGRGLLVGMEFVAEEAGIRTAEELFARDVLVAHTLNNPRVVRIEPPLIITEEQIDLFLSKLRGALEAIGK